MSILFFFLGAIAASFAGVVAGRIHTGQSFFTGRSRCDACGTELRTIDLIPLASHAVRLGKARCCGARIALRAPLSEAVLGALFALAYARLGASLPLVFFLAALFFMAVLVLYDLAHQILPPAFLALFVVSAAAFRALSPSEGPGMAYAALFIAVFLALIHVLSRGRAMGLADAPFAFGLALLAGPYALTGFVFSFWIGAAIGIIVLARRPRGSRMGVEVPFAPYLAVGFLLAYFTTWNLFAYLAGSL